MRELKENEFRLHLEFEDGYTKEHIVLEKITNDNCGETQYESILNTITEFIRRMGFYVPEHEIYAPIKESEYDEVMEKRYTSIMSGSEE